MDLQGLGGEVHEGRAPWSRLKQVEVRQWPEVGRKGENGALSVDGEASASARCRH